MKHAKHILQIFEPGVDGAFRHVEGLVRYLIANGKVVHLAYSSNRDSDQLYQLVNFAEQHGGRTIDLKIGPQPGLSDPAALYRLLNFVRATSADILHAHSSKAGVLGRVAAKIHSLPCFYTPHAYYGMTDAAGLKRNLFRGVEKLLAGWGHSLNVSAEESEFAEHVLKIPPEQRSLIANGVSFADFTPVSAAEKRGLRRSLGLPEDARILCSVARFSYQKNPQQTYAVFQELASRYNDVFLAHIGSGELKASIMPVVANLKDRVKIFDYMANPAELYQASDGFLLTSRYEGMPLSVLEAMATNLPIILTDVPGNQSFAGLGLDQLYYGRTSEELCARLVEWRQSLDAHPTPNHRTVAEPLFSHQVSYGAVAELYAAAHALGSRLRHEPLHTGHGGSS